MCACGGLIHTQFGTDLETIEDRCDSCDITITQQTFIEVS